MNSKKIFKILLVIIALGIIVPQVSHAFNLIDDIALPGLAKFVLFIGNVMAYLAGQALVVVGVLLNWVMGLNTTILNGAAVKIGWVIVRDLANLGFVLAMIFIAFATILRLTSYEAKSILWKLIVAALLINFSLVISGLFIDTAGLMTDYFLNAATGNHPEKISEQITGSMQAQKLYAPKSANDPTMVEISKMDNLDRFFVLIGTMFFVVIFSVVLLIVLGALALMLLYRYFMLSFLVILMPLAWLAWVWPDFSGLWKKWWDNFLKWVFFGPAVTFFIYLAIKVADTMSHDPGLTSLNSHLSGMSVTIGGFGSLIGQMVIVCGLLIGGLIAAEQMGIQGASAAKGMAIGASKAIIGAPLKGGAAVGGAIGGGALGYLRDRIRTAGYTPIQEKKDSKGKVVGYTGGSYLQRLSRTFAATPIVGGAARSVNTWSTAGSKEKIKKYKEELGGLDKGALLAMAQKRVVKGGGFAVPLTGGRRRIEDMNPEESAAYMSLAAEKGIAGNLENVLSEDQLKKIVKNANDRGLGDDVFKNNPLLAKYIAEPKFKKDANGENTEERESQEEAELRELTIAFRKVNPNNLDKKIFESKNFKPEYLLLMSKSGISSVNKNPDKTEIMDAIEKMMKKFSRDDINNLKGEQKDMYQYIQNVINDGVASQRTNKGKPTAAGIQGG